ncbi:MAG TPA: efflux RND transporter periplasmic adaptor subunit [Longimicrobiales bacterium]
MVSSADLSSLRISREATASAHPAGRRRWLIIIAAATVAALVVVALLLTRERVIEVTTASASLRGGGSGGGLSANGYVVARTKASVSSKLAGRLAFLGVQEGDRVTAGTIIARLESAEYDAAVRQAAADVATSEAVRIEAEAGVTQAKRALTRARSLAANSLVAAQAVEDAETGVEVAESRLRAALARTAAARQALAATQANLENTRVRAPFTGTVLRKDAEVGEVVAPSVAGGGLTRGAVVTMADLTTLEVEVDVNEAYISGIRREQPAEIILDAYPSLTFPGHVRQVVPTADRQKATVLVRVIIDSQDPRIMPEMGARVVFGEAADSAGATQAVPTRVFVPAAAVKTEGAETVVYVVSEGRARRRVIEAGPVSSTEREVRRGLSGGEVLILDPAQEIVDGVRVRDANNQKVSE